MLFDHTIATNLLKNYRHPVGRDKLTKTGYSEPRKGLKLKGKLSLFELYYRVHKIRHSFRNILGKYLGKLIIVIL